MIGKNEQLEGDSTNDARVNLISEKRKILQDTSAKIKEEVRLCFEQFAKVLRTREKQLLRQIEAVHNQQLTIIQSNPEIPCSLPSIKINLAERQDLEESILKFGELSSSDRSGIDVRDAEPYKIEDYEDASRDHVTLDKSIKTNQEIEITAEDDKFDDSPESPCDLSFNTSSEAEEASENEITVLMNHNYSFSSDGLRENLESSDQSETKHDSSNSENNGDNKLLNCPEECEFKAVAKTNENLIVPETEENINVEKINSFIKQNNEISLPDRDKNLPSSNDSGSPVENLDTNGDQLMINKKAQDNDKHPKQIQQWLQQILVETETEPTIHEIEQFAEISKSRFKEFQFPLET